jgi:hypothetical protein
MPFQGEIPLGGLETEGGTLGYYGSSRWPGGDGRENPKDIPIFVNQNDSITKVEIEGDGGSIQPV